MNIAAKEMGCENKWTLVARRKQMHVCAQVLQAEVGKLRRDGSRKLIEVQK